LPACRLVLVVLVLILASAITVIPVLPVVSKDQSSIAMVPTAESDLNAALGWLSTNQSSDGSYGAYYQHWAGAAAYALWLNNSQSSKAYLTFRWLANQLDDSGNWFWGSYGEADVPGASLFSVAASGNLNLIQATSVASNLLQFQQTNGGFFGYYSTALSASVPTSVDTSESLRGLIAAKSINASSQQSAVNYLFSLQNADGSFNLTSTKAYDPIYSQGPEPVSITALVLLTLRDASYKDTDTHVSKALNFLTTASTKYSMIKNDTNAVYSASLSALAFSAFQRNANAYDAIAFISSHQNSDGGFRDSTRSSAGSNALDTAWASIALEQVVPSRAFSSFLPRVLLFGLIAGVTALAVIVGLVVYLVRRNKTQTQVKSL
jgi:prenyltransferase beta subunit